MKEQIKINAEKINSFFNFPGYFLYLCKWKKKTPSSEDDAKLNVSRCKNSNVRY